MVEHKYLDIRRQIRQVLVDKKEKAEKEKEKKLKLLAADQERVRLWEVGADYLDTLEDAILGVLRSVNKGVLEGKGKVLEWKNTKGTRFRKESRLVHGEWGYETYWKTSTFKARAAGLVVPGLGELKIYKRPITREDRKHYYRETPHFSVYAHKYTDNRHGAPIEDYGNHNRINTNIDNSHQILEETESLLLNNLIELYK